MAVGAATECGHVPPLDAGTVTVVVAREVERRHGERGDRQDPGEQAHSSILRAMSFEPFAQPLRRDDLDSDPLRQFHAWYEAARAAGTPRPDAVALATASPDGRPSVRFVLLKDADERGFTFYSSSVSRKGRELEANPR